jgi:ribosome-binding ATPase YchF (GTP1/OBG family)
MRHRRLPNVGKSTLFNALTRSGIAAENYPFCTIDPNVGVVPLPDARLDAIAAIVKPAKSSRRPCSSSTSPGWSPARPGRGARQQVPRQHPRDRRHRPCGALLRRRRRHPRAGSVDPIRDIEVIDTELALADMETVGKALDKATKQSKTGDKAQLARKALLERVAAHLDEGRPVRAMDLTDDERAELRELFLLTAKPTMYVANVADDGFDDNPLLDRIAPTPSGGRQVVPVCAAIEAEIVELDEAERAEFLADLGLRTNPA